MRFSIEGECRQCGPLTPIIVRLAMNAGVFRLCTVTCSVCGAHMAEWMTREEFQTLFLKRIKEEK
jgi:hypothetical protein